MSVGCKILNNTTVRHCIATCKAKKGKFIGIINQLFYQILNNIKYEKDFIHYIYFINRH